MNQPTVFMFSGQGSQYYQMGLDLYESNRSFRKTLIELDDVVSGLIGESVLENIYHKNRRLSDDFTTLRITHPAIFMIEYALAKTIMDEGIKPDFVLGASLGTIVAATIAGCFDLSSAISFVVKQAETIDRYCSNGGMTAILRGPEFYHQHYNCRKDIQLAAVNFSNHIIVAGLADNLSEVEEKFGEDLTYLRLMVPYAFHSSWIEPAKVPFCEYLETINVCNPQLPLICSMSGEQITHISGNYFWDIVRQPILFHDTILSMESRGNYNYIDLGPSGTLATFVKNIVSKSSMSKVYVTLSPFGGNIKIDYPFHYGILADLIQLSASNIC